MVTALGSELVSSNSNDLNYVFRNPAILKEDMQKELAANWSFHHAGINYGSTRYAFDTEKLGTIAFGLSFVDYGDFIGADASGALTSEFSAADYVFSAAWSLPITDKITVGVMPKLAYSFIDQYTALAIASDFGMIYNWEEQDANFGVTIKNVGTEILAYNEVREPLPFEIQAGFSKKLQYAPFRFHITLHNLQTLDLSYDDPNLYSRDPISGEIVKDDVSIGDKMLRHAILGIEVFPDKSFGFQFSYNHRRSQELKRELYGRTVGWAWGFHLKIKKFRIQYARANYHLAGATNQLGISTNFKNF